jgi:hypothetical protein
MDIYRDVYWLALSAIVAVLKVSGSEAREVKFAVVSACRPESSVFQIGH